MIAVLAWTLVAAAAIGAAIATTAEIRASRARSTGRTGDTDAPPLTSMGLMLVLNACIALSVLWFITRS